MTILTIMMSQCPNTQNTLQHQIRRPLRKLGLLLRDIMNDHYMI